MGWNYGTRPEKPGLYWVTLIYDEYKDYQPTGRKLAEVDLRSFVDLDKEPEERGWRVQGEPEHGLAWIGETGTHLHETIYAWMDYEEPEIAELPEGVERAE